MDRLFLKLLSICLSLSAFAYDVHGEPKDSPGQKVFRDFNDRLNYVGEGDAACATRSDQTMILGTLSAERRYDVSDYNCEDWNRLGIIGEAIDRAGKLVRNDTGITRSRAAENDRLVFCRYSIVPNAEDIPAEAIYWWREIRVTQPNPKSTPEYQRLRDYAEKVIRLDCEDLIS